MKKIFAGMAALFCVAAGLRPDALLAADVSAREIMTMVYDRADGDDRRSVMTMTLTNRQGRQRIRTVESFSKDYGRDRRNIMIFLEPADVKGTMYLSWDYENPQKEDDRWLYMPALRKDRRISGASRNEYFMGSDFTYDDIGRRHPEKDEQRLLGEETVGGFDCWKIECIPLDPSESYTRRVTWVTKETHLVIKAAYHDKDGLLKTFEALDLQEQDGFWSVYVCAMVNAVTGHRTEMKLDLVRYNTGLEDALFTVSTLQRGRI